METGVHDQPRLVADTLTFSRTVDRFIVHREALGEVFLTDTCRLNDDRYAAGAQLPRSHAYYGDHVVRPALYDVVLLMEACRQAAVAGAHIHYEVPVDHKFILTHFGIHLLYPQRIEVGPRPCELCLLVTTQNRRVRDGQVTGLDFEIMLEVAETTVGQVSLGLRFKSPADYTGLRLRNRHGTQLPPSTTRPQLPLGTLVDGQLVGRSNPDNVVLADADASERGARAVLRVPLNHPSMFDHPQDHIPGMVLGEGARQLALYAVTEHLGIAPSKMHVNDLHAVFKKFGELEPVTELSLELGERSTADEPSRGVFRTQGGPLAINEERQSPQTGRLVQVPVWVDALQDGESICTMEIVVTTLAGLIAKRAA